MRQIVLAERDFDLHARVGVVAEHLHDSCQRLAVRGGLLDQFGDDDLAGTRAAAIVRRHENVLIDALVLGEEKPHTAILVKSADDLAVGARDDVDDLSLRPAAAIDAGDACGDSITVQRLMHLPRREEQIRSAVVGHEETVTVGMALNRACDEIELRNQAELALAVGHHPAVALHCGKTRGKQVARRGFDVQCAGEIVGAHRCAAFAQEFDNRVAGRNLRVAAVSARRALQRVSVVVFRPRFL